MGVAENKQVVRRIVDEILNGGDLDAIDELVAENYVDLDGGPSGREGYRRVVKTMHAAFPDVLVSIEGLIGEKDIVVGRFTITGTHEAEFLGFPPTGRSVTFKGMGWIRVVGGQMRERQNISDLFGLAEQLR